MSTIELADWVRDDETWVRNTKTRCRAECKFRIVDVATGQEEIFCGAGLGDNDVWSDTSAITVAFKEALLLYFFTAWPQPVDFNEVIRKELEGLKGEEQIAAIQSILPAKAMETITESGAFQALRDFYTKQFGGK